MPKCTADELDFGRIKRRRITANFAGGALSSDGGLMLLRQVDRKIGLSAAAAAVIHDPRHADLITHSLRDLIAQRLYALACVLRRSRIDGAKHAPAVIKLLVSYLRQHWPKTRFIVRGDSGFCRQRLIRWCEHHDVGYVIGVARNARLQVRALRWEVKLENAYRKSGQKQRCIREFRYAADSWNRKRRVITRLEFGAQGNNPRFVVTNLTLPANELYDALYCQRGEAENRIKEAQLDLFGTRASCHRFLANWLRILFLGPGLYVDTGPTTTGPARHRAGESHQRHDQDPSVENRRLRYPQYPAYPPAVCLPPSVARRVCACCTCALSVTRPECCPGTLTNNGGWGELCPKIRKSPVSRSVPRQAPLFAKPMCPTAHQAKNGEISGLAHRLSSSDRM